MPIQYQSAVLVVKDIKASRHFYEELLGQQVLIDHGPNVGYVGGFALWEMQHAYQILGHTAQPPETLGSHNLELYFESADPEAEWERLAAANVKAVHPVQEQPWGQRVVRVYDPDGHIVEIGEPMSAVVLRFLAEGLSPTQVAERASMPLEFVQQIANG
jgi:catechol 2,3-dioxygenase-like lactoylglutathione lyase family enzyme